MVKASAVAHSRLKNAKSKMLHAVYHKKKKKKKQQQEKTNQHSLIHDGKCFWNTFKTHQFACNYLVY